MNEGSYLQENSQLGGQSENFGDDTIEEHIPYLDDYDEHNGGDGNYNFIGLGGNDIGESNSNMQQRKGSGGAILNVKNNLTHQVRTNSKV